MEGCIVVRTFWGFWCMIKIVMGGGGGGRKGGGGRCGGITVKYA